MTVSEYIWDYLQKRGLTKVFMVSGSSAMWLTDALYKNKKLEAICTHHEQAAAMAADGYGRVNDCPGACLVTIGPGATNAITGVAQAYLDSSPMFVISGQASSKLLKYEVETGIRQHGTQSLNLEPIVSSITKYFVAIMEPDDIVKCMDEAFVAAVSDRPGPVWIDVPVDVQNKQVSKEAIDKGEIAESSISGESLDLSEVREKISLAKKPLILAGYGVRASKVSDMMLEFAENNLIPIVTSRGGIDVIATDHPLFIGRPGAYGDRASHFAVQNCDLLLILGSRLSVSTIGYYPKELAGKAVKIMVDIDEKELAKDDVPVDIKINADLEDFFDFIIPSTTRKNEKYRMDWLEKCKAWEKKYPNVLPEYALESPLNSYYFTDVLSKIAGENADIVVDTGSVCNVVSQSWTIKDGQRYLISGGLSCMGFWATALGVYKEGRQTIAISGDGSTSMNIQEFATLAYNKIPIKLFVYNNNGYMLIRHNQHNYMDDRFLGVGPDSGVKTPDFCKVASAYGLKTIRIEKGDVLEAKIKEVLDFDGPVVCEVMLQEFAPIQPRIASRVMPDGSLKAAEFDDLFPFLEEENDN